MRTTRRFHLSLALVILLAVPGCVHAPPNLSPSGVAAFNATRVVKALDVLRDFAVDANAQIPPLLSTATTRKVVTYHRSAVTTIGAVPSGWVPVVTTGLDEVLRDLPDTERATLTPYVALVKTLILEVSR